MKTQLQQMTLHYSSEELADLRNLKKFNYSKTYIGENGVTWTNGKYDAQKWVENFLVNRGCVAPKINMPGIAAFGHVPMHIDNSSTNNYLTLIFPIKGIGELAHFEDEEKYQKKQFKESLFTHDAMYPLIFDDSLPHSFAVCDKDCDRACHRCVAILANVHVDSLKQIFDLRKL